jgi:5-methylcytosine-specific restriction endonuclease McrA
MTPAIKRSTADRGLGGAHRADRKRKLAAFRDGQPCPRCGRPMWSTQDLDLDHVVSRVFGGAGGPTALSHRSCNRRAGAALSTPVRLARLRLAARKRSAPILYPPVPLVRRW